MHMMEKIREYLSTIVFPSEINQLDLMTALRNLDEVVAENGEMLDPKLRHFLQNRSYEKALLWIDGGQPAKGGCQK